MDLLCGISDIHTVISQSEFSIFPSRGINVCIYDYLHVCILYTHKRLISKDYFDFIYFLTQ